MSNIQRINKQKTNKKESFLNKEKKFKKEKNLSQKNKDIKKKNLLKHKNQKYRLYDRDLKINLNHNVIDDDDKSEYNYGYCGYDILENSGLEYDDDDD